MVGDDDTSRPEPGDSLLDISIGIVSEDSPFYHGSESVFITEPGSIELVTIEGLRPHENKTVSTVRSNFCPLDSQVSAPELVNALYPVFKELFHAHGCYHSSLSHSPHGADQQVLIKVWTVEPVQLS